MKIILFGATGRVGKTVQQLQRERGDFEIVAGFNKSGQNECDFPIYTDKFELRYSGIRADCIIDFSVKEILDDLLFMADHNKLPLVTLVNRLEDNDYEALKLLSEIVPVFYTEVADFAFDNYLDRIEQANLSHAEEITITSKQHWGKKGFGDAPKIVLNTVLGENSRTTSGLHGDEFEKRVLKLGKGDIFGNKKIFFQLVRSTNADTKYSSHIRYKVVGEPSPRTLRYTARGGTKTFAKTALLAARFLQDKPPGLYNLSDLKKALMPGSKRNSRTLR